VLQGHYGLNQQVFAVVFGAGAVALIGATQMNVVLLDRFTPQRIVVGALVVATVAGVVFTAVTVTRFGGIVGFLLPAWTVLAAMGFVLPNAPALALSRHPEASGTAAALLGAAQFGLGAVVAPAVGMLGNDERALALVMTVGAALALILMSVVRPQPVQVPDAVVDSIPERA
jgi:DHA1 family bicyclomycin/chloramphenicol resistance-like MFS transporter